MRKSIEIESNEEDEGDIESKWFLIYYDAENQILNVKLKSSEINSVFKEIRKKFEGRLKEINDPSSIKIVSGQYGNAISSLKRSIMQEFVIVVTGVFLHHFDIDTTYATAKLAIKGLFGLSVKREMILSSFSTRGRTAGVKSGWFNMTIGERTILYDAFRLFFDPQEQYKKIKNNLDEVVSTTK